jgi:hypothetical protein
VHEAEMPAAAAVALPVPVRTVMVAALPGSPVGPWLRTGPWLPTGP